MPRIDDPEFRAWLTAESGLDLTAENPEPRCDNCGVAAGVYPFIGDHCAFCLAFMFGRFRKSQEIAMWIDRNLWLLERGDINKKASAISSFGLEHRMPRADETDEEFASRCRANAKARA